MNNEIRVVPHALGGYQNLDFHRQLMADRARTEAFRAAIHAVVKPGDVVADIGTGSGILSLFACQPGARKVFAVESGPVAEVAKMNARQNGFGDRLHVLTGNAELADLPQVDVLISECIGYYVHGGDMVPLVCRLRDRLLKEGSIIPRALRLYLAPVDAPQFDEITGFWRQKPYGFDLSPAEPHASCNLYLGEVEKVQLAAPPALVESIDLYRDRPDGFLHFSGEFELPATCRVNGLCGWFEVDTAPGIVLDTAPGAPTTVWKQTFFPVGPFIAGEGQRLLVDLRLLPNGWGPLAIFEWSTILLDGAGVELRSERRSTRDSFPGSRELLLPAAPSPSPGSRAATRSRR